MNLTVSFDPSSPDEVNAAIATLHKFINMEQREATFTPVQLPAVALDKLDDPSAGAEPKPEAPKRTRKAKEDAAAPSGESQPQTSGSAPSTEESTTAPAASASLTLDDVRAALMTYTKKHSMDAGVELLKKFGAQRISELPAEKFAEFVKEAA